MTKSFVTRVLTSSGLVLSLLMAFAGCAQIQQHDTKPPNILFILIDDMGYGDLGVTGNQAVPTPNIDQLAENGLLMENFYVASPICSPSRVALLTGQNPAEFQIHSFIHNRAANQKRAMANYLPADVFTLADLTKGAGYRTAHVGKWHMGGGRDVDDAPLPGEYGFDYSYVSFEGLGDRLLFADHQNRLSEQSAALGQGKIDWRAKHQTTESYVDKAMEFIAQPQSQPFYLQLWLNDVHDPHMPSQDMLASVSGDGLSEYQHRFHATLSNMDQQLGRLFNYLRDSGLRQNTLIILTSDNGPVGTAKYYQNGQQPPGSTAGLRGRKWSLYEGGIRMPLLVQWPEKIPAGITDSETLMAAKDLLPTLAALLGEPALSSSGESRLQSWQGTPQLRRSTPIYWEFGSTGELSAHPVPFLPTDRSPKLALRDNQWKLLVNQDGSQMELYNIRQDPFESTNLAEQYPEVAKRLTATLLAWRSGFRPAPH